MSNRAELQPREAECRTVGDYVSLAIEALAEPSDEDYARSLLEKAELLCQMPHDYIKLAKVVGLELDEPRWTMRLLDKAAALGGDRFAWSEMGTLARRIGESNQADAFIAAPVASSAAWCRSMGHRTDPAA